MASRPVHLQSPPQTAPQMDQCVLLPPSIPSTNPHLQSHLMVLTRLPPSRWLPPIRPVPPIRIPLPPPPHGLPRPLRLCQLLVHLHPRL